MSGLVRICQDFGSQKKRGHPALIAQCGLANVEEAVWIKPKNNLVKPLLLTFRTEMPEFIDIPGEKLRTKVQEYLKRPVVCRKCSEYGHSTRVCQGQPRCQNCGSSDHTEECTQPKSCYHCKKEHNAGDRTCKEYRYEEEIISLQSKLRVAKSQAIAIFNRENPNYRTVNYAESVKRKATEQESRDVTRPNKTKKTVHGQSLLPGHPSTSGANLEPVFEILPPDELTCRNNPVLRAEALKEFENFDPGNDDITSYENELKNQKDNMNAKKPETPRTPRKNYNTLQKNDHSLANEKSSPKSSKASGKKEERSSRSSSQKKDSSSHRGDRSRSGRSSKR